MGMQHECKKGTVIEVNGVRIEVLRGSPRLEITANTNAGMRLKECPSTTTSYSRGKLKESILRSQDK